MKNLNFKGNALSQINLSVCIIVKNEEQNLKKCLEALSAYPFEVVVVDTGSTDGTVKAAEQYTKNVYTFSWCDDFSAAKNFAIGKAANEMVLVLDSDEYIEPMKEDDWQHFLAQLQEKRNKVGRIFRRNFFTENQERRESQEWINRIFSKEKYHYEGCIHEQVTALDGKAYETYQTPVVILHSGYDLTPEEKRKKAKRNISLLEKELEELESVNLESTGQEDAPGAAQKAAGEVAQEAVQTARKKQLPYVLYQLGKSYFLMEDYVAACTYFDKGLAFDLDPKSEYVIDMVESYGYALINSGREKDALSFEGIYEEFSPSADFLFLMGLIYMKNARFDEAIQEFLNAAGKKTAKTVGTNSYLAYYNIGVILECLGNLKEAVFFYQKCGAYEKAEQRLAILGDKVKNK